MATSTQVRWWWRAWRCDTSKMVRVPFPGVDRTWVLLVADRSVPLWLEFIAVMHRFGYEFRESAGGTYRCRKIAGSILWSLHAYGVACDLNPKANPFRTHINDYPPGFVAAVEAITVNGKRAFTWGGRWSKPDTMHWQINVAPKDIPEGDDMRLARGAAGLEVAEVQKMMAERFGQDNGAWSPFAGRSLFDGQAFEAGEDGDYGGTCEANVKRVEQILGRAPTGIVDQLLWDAMVNRSYVNPPTVDLTGFVSRDEFDTHGHDEGQTGPPV